MSFDSNIISFSKLILLTTARFPLNLNFEKFLPTGKDSLGFNRCHGQTCETGYSSLLMDPVCHIRVFLSGGNQSDLPL